jgi:hypothetical protein
MRAEDMAQFRFSEGGRQYVLLVPPSQAREVRGDSPIRADLHRYLDSHPRARVYDVTGVRSAGESFTDRELTNREVNVRDILRG